MMSTTTIRIDEVLKARISAAAESAGTTSHAFILDAIEQRVEQAELNDDFHRIADERWAKIPATGKTVPWYQARTYLEARAQGDRPPRPISRKPVGPKPGS
jgi:predicted transcriptional regulator